MARPTTIRIGDGTVILKNFSKEKVEEIKALLTQPAPTPAKVETPVAPQVELQVAEVKPVEITTELIKKHHVEMYEKTEDLKDLAVGIRKSIQGNWELVTVKYNADSKRATVSDVKSFGPDRPIAIGELKVKITRLFLM